MTDSASVLFVDSPTETVEAAGATFVYREVGLDRGESPPIVALTRLGANLDGWDPEVVDPLGLDRRVILLGYRGVGGSSGIVRDSIDAMAADAIAVIRALGLSRVDLFGLSMGGMVAQAVVERAPELVGRMIVAGAAPQGGVGMTAMAGVMLRSIVRGIVTITDPTDLLFFTRTPVGRAAATAYSARLARRRAGRDARVSAAVFVAQLRAVARWGRQPAAAATTSRRIPVLIVHGDDDRMIPVQNVPLLVAAYPHAEVRTYDDSGHGVVSQNRASVTGLVRRFLRR